MAVMAGSDQGGPKRGRGSLILRMILWVWGCANSRLKP